MSKVCVKVIECSNVARTSKLPLIKIEEKKTKKHGTHFIKSEGKKG